MFFGLTMEKVALIAVIATLIIGPERLPSIARALREGLQKATRWTRDFAKEVADSGGDEFDDIDWRKLDPRQYDPRRIIREALLENPVERGTTATPQSSLAAEPLKTRGPKGPYDTSARLEPAE